MQSQGIIVYTHIERKHLRRSTEQHLCRSKTVCYINSLKVLAQKNQRKRGEKTVTRKKLNGSLDEQSKTQNPDKNLNQQHHEMGCPLKLQQIEEGRWFSIEGHFIGLANTHCKKMRMEERDQYLSCHLLPVEET